MNNETKEQNEKELLFDYFFNEIVYPELKGKYLQILMNNKKVVKQEFMDKLEVLKGNKLKKYMIEYIQELINKNK